MKEIAFDISMVAGIACITYAAYQLHAAAAWLTAGLALSAWGMFGSMRKEKTKK